ncbi:MAG: hypothetical protein IPL65_21755 [Lewinellaceae bacterium]|nr:hypothetical protein [Lewinellaceae bacterium]
MYWPGEMPMAIKNKLRSPIVRPAWLLLFLLVGCAPLLRVLPYQPEPVAQERSLRQPGFICGGWSDYLTGQGDQSGMSMRYLRVNMHVMDNASGTALPLPSDSIRVFLRTLLEKANADLDTNIRNWRSPEGTAILPKGYRYVLWPQPGDDGIYFHNNDALCYFVSQGKYQNNQKRDVIEQYGIGTDSIVNIFVQVHPPDSIASPTYRAGIQGIALGTNLKIAGALELGSPPWRSVGNLNHEMGHVLGLSHAWLEDGCPDTENHPNKCWTWSKDPPCRDQASNNTMDYNSYQIAMTPCQIGRIQAIFANLKHPIRARLIPTWCQYQPDKSLTISDSIVWSGARDQEGDLIVSSTGRLRLSCRVSMPPGSQILVQPGGVLWLDGAYLHNACGKPWKGIMVQEKGTLAGKVMTLTPAIIENVENSRRVK